MDLKQAMDMMRLRQGKSAEEGGETRDAIAVARRVFTVSAAAGDPYVDRKPEDWARQWLVSRRFTLVEVAPHQVAVPYANRINHEKVQLTIRASADGRVEPIVIDLNKQRIGKTMGGYVPKVIVVDGKHRHRAQILQGKDRVLAWVGELALRELQARANTQKKFVIESCSCEVVNDGAKKSKMESQAILHSAMTTTLPGVRATPPGGGSMRPTLPSGGGVSRTSVGLGRSTSNRPSALEADAGGPGLGNGSGSNPVRSNVFSQGARSSGQLKLDPSDRVTSDDPSDRNEAEWEPDDPQDAAPGAKPLKREEDGVWEDTGADDSEMSKGVVKADKMSPGSGVGPELRAGPIKVKKIVTDKKRRMEAVAPPGREAQVKKLKPKVGVENAFKIAWSQYNDKK